MTPFCIPIDMVDYYIAVFLTVSYYYYYYYHYYIKIIRAIFEESKVDAKQYF